MDNNVYNGFEIAIIGMAVRAPKVKNISDLWRNLVQGEELISFFSDEELIEAGVSDDLLSNPNYVKASSFMDNKQYFDSSFFGYSPEEAKNMDPQIRLFHECVYEGLEDAGYSPYTGRKKIGLFAGAGPGLFWEINSLLSPGSIDGFSASLLRDRTYMVSRIAYKLNLNGPAVFMHTACSTSLVAICKACDSLLLGECEMSVAGGISLKNDSKKGYLYNEGMILSPDGHCRSFDIEANGTISGEGAGVVILKRLKKALADRDNIYAIIKGYHINNDGNTKVGYTAPSVNGQVEAIMNAHKMANVGPQSISYVEAHGTATKLGDAVEIQALTKAFGKSKEKYCAIGSIKSNIGHLDTAAGVIGLIKTVLSLKHRKLVPSLNFNKSNPNIDFESGPFYVNTSYKDWDNDLYPLRAGVSAFGIGGTNAHVVLEAVPNISSSTKSRGYQLIQLSAKTPSALERMTNNLKEYFEENKNVNLADVSYTLQTGRYSHNIRKMFVCENVQHAINILSNPNSNEIKSSKLENISNPVIFMFPGQGSQYIDMGKGLYSQEKYFKEEIDKCFSVASEFSSVNFKRVLFPGHDENDFAQEINNTAYTQPLIFFMEYCMARLLMNWGIVPHFMIGHSIGEYVAACISGVFSLEDAIRLVIKRGEIMQKLPSGNMLSVSISESKLISYLNHFDNISLAAVNSPELCVVSGTVESIQTFKTAIEKDGYKTIDVRTSHAFHSYMMEPILKEFGKELSTASINKPTIPYVSNVSGYYIDFNDISKPEYWNDHLRNTVRFADGVETLMSNNNAIFVEVGPGKTLSSFVQQCKLKKPSHYIVNTVRHPKELQSDLSYLIRSLGEIWLYGFEPNWDKFYINEQRNKISLPKYSFEKTEYPYQVNIDELGNKAIASSGQRKGTSDWYYRNIWEQRDIDKELDPGLLKYCTWLVFTDEMHFSNEFLTRLKSSSGRVVEVHQGSAFEKINEGTYRINPYGAEEDYNRLFVQLKGSNSLPDFILHFWQLSKSIENQDLLENIEKDTDLGFNSLINIAKSIGLNKITKNIRIYSFVNGLQRVTGLEKVNPNKSMAIGAAKIISVEYKNIDCVSIDVELNQKSDQYNSVLADLIQREFYTATDNIIIAYRGYSRFVKCMHPIKVDRSDVSKFKEKGVYLVIGGFGGMGYTLASHLAETYKSHIVLIVRSDFPERKDWSDWLLSHEEENEKSSKIRDLLTWEESGAEIMLARADVDNYERMKEVIGDVRDRFGRINGVIHAAGVIDYGGIIHKRTKEITWKYLAAKIKGTINVYNLLKTWDLDFLLLISSVGNDLYPVKYGQLSYNSANEFLESFSDYISNMNKWRMITINMCDWNDVGMSVKASNSGATQFSDGISQKEGIDVFERLLQSNIAKVSVYPNDLLEEINKSFQIMHKYHAGDIEDQASGTKQYKLNDRLQLSTDYIKPTNKTEQQLVEIYQKFFGINEIGIRDDFYEIGGDSLKAISLIAQIQSKLDKEISIIEFLSNTTIEQIAKFLSSTVNSKKYNLKQVQPFFFGESKNKLFGVIHTPKTNTKIDLGVVLCYPIGQEYIRSHRVFLILANELSNIGIPCLRFDYFGHGDSSGQSDEVTLETLVDNIQSAVNELKERTERERIILVGARLGGTLSYLYSRMNSLEGIVLWNSIYDGKKYIDAIAENYHEWLNGSFAKHKKNGDCFEAFGFTFSHRFIQEINNLKFLVNEFNANTNFLILDSQQLDKTRAFESLINSKNSKVMYNKSDVKDFWLKHDENVANFFEPEQDIHAICKWIENFDHLYVR